MIQINNKAIEEWTSDFLVDFFGSDNRNAAIEELKEESPEISDEDIEYELIPFDDISSLVQNGGLVELLIALDYHGSGFEVRDKVRKVWDKYKIRPETSDYIVELTRDRLDKYDEILKKYQ